MPKTGKLNITNEDCMDLMKDYSDKFFDLAIVDPPYGIGEDGGSFRDRKGGGHRVLPKKQWDSTKPTKEYWSELFRVSKNQIVWGGNYFTDYLKESRGWIYWDKLMGGDFSDGELAWTSFDRALKKFTKCNKYHGKIHPTEKPVQLYEWLLKNYAKEGDKILDTHLGSGSSAIACYYAGYDLTACELDKEYCDAAIKRIKNQTQQIKLL